MLNYRINEETLAIFPYHKKSKVYENRKSFIVNESAYSIIEDSCKYFGSSFEGRKKGSVFLTGITYKTPIIIEETKEIIFFPTTSPRRNYCSWISLNNLENYYEEKGKIKLVFNNKKEILLDVSYGVINNQVLRASRLESTLRKSKKNKEKIQ